jgi:hypothetical protein
MSEYVERKRGARSNTGSSSRSRTHHAHTHAYTQCHTRTPVSGAAAHASQSVDAWQHQRTGANARERDHTASAAQLCAWRDRVQKALVPEQWVERLAQRPQSPHIAAAESLTSTAALSLRHEREIDRVRVIRLRVLHCRVVLAQWQGDVACVTPCTPHVRLTLLCTVRGHAAQQAHTLPQAVHRVRAGRRRRELPIRADVGVKGTSQRCTIHAQRPADTPSDGGARVAARHLLVVGRRGVVRRGLNTTEEEAGPDAERRLTRRWQHCVVAKGRHSKLAASSQRSRPQREPIPFSVYVVWNASTRCETLLTLPNTCITVQLPAVASSMPAHSGSVSHALQQPSSEACACPVIGIAPTRNLEPGRLTYCVGMLHTACTVATAAQHAQRFST